MNDILKKMMKPMPIFSTDTNLKDSQEDTILNYLANFPYSVSVADATHDVLVFPGCVKPDGANMISVMKLKRKAITATFRRLERKGKIISTLYRGKRYYSIPIVGGF